MQELIDFSYLYEIADNDDTYIHEVLNIFLDTVPEGLQTLAKLINTTTDWLGIYKQAHFLKSSLSVIKIGNIFAQLNHIEIITKTAVNGQEILTDDQKQLKELMQGMQQQFGTALPLLKEKFAKG